MADNVGYTPGAGAVVAADEIAGVLHQRVKLGVGADGVAVDVSTANPMPVTGTVTANTGLSQPLTDAQLRASAVPVSGPLTDTQLRALAVPISGTVTANTGLAQPLTDTQLRASAVPVSGPLTDTQLRATAVPVSVASIVLPTGASTLAEQQSQTTILGSIDTKNPTLVSGRVPVDSSGVTQPISAASLPLPAGAATEAGNLSTIAARTPALGQATMSVSTPVVLSSDQSAVPVINSDSFQQTYSVAGVIPINTILLTVDLIRHRGLSVQIVSLGTTGFITPEWSIDNATWVTAVLFTPAGQTNSSFNLVGIWNAQKQARYFRLRLSTATTAGTTTIYTEAYQTTPQLFYATTSVSTSAGSAFFGDVGQQYRGSSTGAASGAHLISAATTNATIVKASGGRVLGWALANTTASWRYVKLHNQTTTPTAGTGVVRTIAIPPNGLAQMKLEGGISFATGIGLTTVTGSADADTAVVALGDIVGELFFA